MSELLDKLFPQPEKGDYRDLFAEPAGEEREANLYLPIEVQQQINSSCVYDWQDEPFDMGKEPNT